MSQFKSRLALKANSFKKLFRQKRFFLPLMLLIVILAVAAAAVVGHPKSDKAPSAKESVAAAPADICTGTIDFGCYRNELTTITQEQGPEKAFNLVKQQYEQSAFVKASCHQLAHVIGRAAYAKYGNLSGTFTHGDQFCWSGYYHGAMEELSKEKGQSAVTSANSICADLRAKQTHSFYHYNCVHGLGHGFMFILNQNLFNSLTACDSLTDSFERTSCYGGTFMQNIMNEQAPDKDDQTAAELKPNEPMYPCTAVAEQYKQQCYLMQTSYALQVESYDFAKVFDLCTTVAGAYRDTCYQSLGRDASGQSISDVQQTMAKCILGPSDEAQRFCIRGAAYDFVSYFHNDKPGYELCSAAPANLRDDCRVSVKSYYASF